MQIKLQSDNYHVLLNTLGAELNSYSNPSGNEYVWNSDPAYWLRSSPLLFSDCGKCPQRRNCYQGSYIPDAQAWFFVKNLNLK